MGERSRPDLADPDESAAGAERADALARSELLRAALIGVIERYEPEVARVLRGEAPHVAVLLGDGEQLRAAGHRAARAP